MTRHARIPAFIAMVLTAAVGLAIFAVTGQFRTTDLAHATLADLEKKIVGNQDARVWLAYGDRLREAARYDMAAQAYHRAGELQSELVEARLGEGLALGQAAVGKSGSAADGFFEYVTRLSGAYPKVAVDLLDRPELRPLHADERWAPAAAGAKAQAVD
jgi:hypothetical protein